LPPIFTNLTIACDIHKSNYCLWYSQIYLTSNLKSEGQQFHQYQQNRQPPIASTHKYNNNKKTMTYGNGNPCPGLGEAQKCGIIKPIMDGLVVYLLFKSFCLFFLFYRSVHSRYVNMVMTFKTDVIAFITNMIISSM
jgi:hypothetical protein